MSEKVADSPRSQDSLRGRLIGAGLLAAATICYGFAVWKPWASMEFTDQGGVRFGPSDDPNRMYLYQSLFGFAIMTLIPAQIALAAGALGGRANRPLQFATIALAAPIGVLIALGIARPQDVFLGSLGETSVQVTGSSWPYAAVAALLVTIVAAHMTDLAQVTRVRRAVARRTVSAGGYHGPSDLSIDFGAPPPREAAPPPSGSLYAGDITVLPETRDRSPFS